MSNIYQKTVNLKVTCVSKNRANNPYAEGNYMYEIIASNNAGQDNQSGNVVIKYNVPNGVVPVISNDSASPNPFDPNNETTTIFYSLNTTADVTVRIKSGNSVI